MSLVDYEGSVEYPFSKKTVFDALMAAAPKIDGLELDSADEVSGRVTFKAGLSLASWGEIIPVQLIEVAPTRTQMKVMSSPKTGIMFGGAMDLGKNRRNIEKIISAVSDVLSTKPSEIEKPKPVSVSSTTDELIKLKSLLDSGVLSQEEFDEQKKKVLAQEPVVEIIPQPEQQKPNSAPVRIESEKKDHTVTYLLVAFFILVIIGAIASAV
jgi:hypothetical protein